MGSRLPVGFALLLVGACQLEGGSVPDGLPLTALAELPMTGTVRPALVREWARRHGFAACTEPNGYENDSLTVEYGGCGTTEPIPFEGRHARLSFRFLRPWDRPQRWEWLTRIELVAPVPDIVELEGTRAPRDLARRAALAAWGEPTKRCGGDLVWTLPDRFVIAEYHDDGPADEAETVIMLPRDQRARHYSAGPGGNCLDLVVDEQQRTR